MSGVVVGLCAVILTVRDNRPRVLTVRVGPGVDAEELATSEIGAEPSLAALPYGPLDPTGDKTLERALRRWVRAQTGFELGYCEQLYTFGDRFRNPSENKGGRRVVSVAYLALVSEGRPSSGLPARWTPVYELLPWEDWRQGRPAFYSEILEPAIRCWIEAGVDDDERRGRRERSSIAFGLGDSPWDGERVLERYELVYELGLVPEAQVDRGEALDATTSSLGRPMIFDHRRVLTAALGRLRGKLRYRPVIFELLPETFTLTSLQQTAEALAGVRLHKQNFRRLVDRAGLVDGTGAVETETGGRPAELFRFRREVLEERPAPGVRLPLSK